MSMQPGWIQFKFIMIIKMECCCIQLKSLVWFVELCQWVGWFQHQLWLDSFRYANQKESALMLLNWELIESATVRGWMKTAARGTTHPMAPIQIGSIQLRSNGFYRARKRGQCRNLIKRATRRNDKSANLIKSWFLLWGSIAIAFFWSFLVSVSLLSRNVGVRRRRRRRRGRSVTWPSSGFHVSCVHCNWSRCNPPIYLSSISSIQVVLK